MKTGASASHRILATLAVCVVALTTKVQADTSPAGAQSVDRVGVRYHDGKFEIVSRTSIRKVLPPSDTLPAGAAHSGFWYELRTLSGEVRYRRIWTDPTRVVFEEPATTASGAIVTQRAEGDAKDIVFSVLVPKANAGDRLVFFGLPAGAKDRGEKGPSKMLASLDVKSLAKPLEKDGGTR